MPHPDAFVLVALLALAVRLGSLLALHLLPTGMSPMRDPVSRYALSRFGALDGVQKFAGGVCSLSLAFVLVRLHALVSAVGPGELVINGLALLLIVTVPATTDDVSAVRTLRWQLHAGLALLGYVTFTLAAFSLTASIVDWRAWHGPAALLALAEFWAVVAIILFGRAGVVASWRPYLGLFQRAAYLGMLSWLAAALLPLAVR
jgi:hypothetical protein